MPVLPVGEVTFCFTDIEGSTRLARQLGDRWLPLLQRHNELLRSVWLSHGGVEVKTEGDSFFVAFAEPSNALAAAVDAQRSLEREALGLRVRIGLHTGVAEVEAHDYIGVEVHRASRIADAAHGGQVLLSGATAALTGPAQGGALEDLGLFSLRGFDEPERLLRVTHPDLRENGTAPRVSPAAAHNLPLLRSTFLGRDDDVAELVRLCEKEPLVTVLGPGGAGKTRIALETARRLARGDGDGVWAVLLAGEPAGADIVPVIARTLGVADVPGQAGLDTLIDHLRRKCLLLVLDNCEQVQAAAADFTDRVLRECPEVHLLATSRQSLGVDGERVWELPALGLPPAEAAIAEEVLSSAAGQLFVDRASTASHRFRLNDQNAVAVAALCHALDGLPLALELAAAASRSLPLEVLCERVVAGTVRLRSTNPTHPQRQQTVEDLIGWSYELLDEAQAAVFRRLSVFRGGWALEAAEQVCQGGLVGEQDVLPALGDLVDRSLVAMDGDRYRLLVTVRAYAERQLWADEGDRHRTEQQFWSWASEAADQVLANPNHDDSVRTKADEYANLHAARDQVMRSGVGGQAFSLTMALAGHDAARGHLRSAIGAMQALAPTLHPGSAEHVRVQINIAMMLDTAGDLDAAVTVAEAAEAAAEAAGEDALAHEARTRRALALLQLGRAAEALDIAEQLLRQATSGAIRGRDLELRARALGGFDDDRCAEAFGEAARHYRAEGMSGFAVTMLLNRANELSERDPRGVVEDVAEALATARDLGQPYLIGHALSLACQLRRILASNESDGVLPPDIINADPDELVRIADQSGAAGVQCNAHLQRAAFRIHREDWSGALEDLMRAAPLVRLVRQVSPAESVLVLGTCILAGMGNPAAGEFVAMAVNEQDPLLVAMLGDVVATQPAGDVLAELDRMCQLLEALSPVDVRVPGR